MDEFLEFLAEKLKGKTVNERQKNKRGIPKIKKSMQIKNSL